jgi:hypothetical protein
MTDHETLEKLVQQWRAMATANQCAGSDMAAIGYVRCADELASLLTLVREDGPRVDQRVLIGGNHLANALLGAGMDPPQWRQRTFSEVSAQFGEQVADIWACWRAIMDWRDGRSDGPHHEQDRPTKDSE